MDAVAAVSVRYVIEDTAPGVAKIDAVILFRPSTPEGDVAVASSDALWIVANGAPWVPGLSSLPVGDTYRNRPGIGSNGTPGTAASSPGRFAECASSRSDAADSSAVTAVTCSASG